jgi:hypothetical protein
MTSCTALAETSERTLRELLVPILLALAGVLAGPQEWRS